MNYIIEIFHDEISGSLILMHSLSHFHSQRLIFHTYFKPL